MSSKESDAGAIVLTALKAGSITTALCLLLLFPLALLVYTGRISEGAGGIGAYAIMAVCALLTQQTYVLRRGEGGPLSILLEGGTVFLLLLLIKAGIGGEHMDPGGLLPAFVSSLAGYVAGSLMKINKKYSGRRKRKPRYNK